MDLDNIFKRHKHKFIALAILLVSMILIMLVPSTIDNPDDPVLHLKSKQQGFAGQTNPLTIFLFIVADLLPILYLAVVSEEELFARKRSLTEVWKDIPQDELISYGLLDAKNQHFIEDSFLVPTNDENLFLIRYPVKTEGKFYNLTIDMYEDWQKRNKHSPIFAFWKSNIGIDRAKQVLGKTSAGSVGRFIRTAQSYGIKPEDLRAEIAKNRIDEERRKLNSPPESE